MDLAELLRERLNSPLENNDPLKEERQKWAVEKREEEVKQQEKILNKAFPSDNCAPSPLLIKLWPYITFPVEDISKHKILFKIEIPGYYNIRYLELYNKYNNKMENYFTTMNGEGNIIDKERKFKDIVEAAVEVKEEVKGKKNKLFLLLSIMFVLSCLAIAVKELRL